MGGPEIRGFRSGTISAKSFGRGITEYKKIASVLKAGGVFDDKAHLRFKTMVDTGTEWSTFTMRYRTTKFFEICTGQLSDITETVTIIRDWIRRHQNIIDERP
jgi:hypothetical protein